MLRILRQGRPGRIQSFAPESGYARRTLVANGDLDGLKRLAHYCLQRRVLPRWQDLPTRFYIDVNPQVVHLILRQAGRLGLDCEQEADPEAERPFLPLTKKEEGV
jgi:hypothetical protein